jgi:uncharacterized protein (DUF1778 family)
MKTERLTLLVTSAEKEQIGRQAGALGISPSEFVLKAANLLDADDIEMIEGIHALLPEFNAAIDRIHANLTAALDSNFKQNREIERLHSSEYRKEILESLIHDGRAEINAAADLFGGGSTEQTTPAQSQPVGSRTTLFERMTAIARAAARTSVEGETLNLPSELGKKKA